MYGDVQEKNTMTFEFNGEKYNKVSTHQKEWGNKIISEFKFRGNERILDLGCGDGTLTDQLAELVPKGFVNGIDASWGMIEEAQKHAKANLQFTFLDINHIEFRNEYDLVFSNATLHWIKDHHSLLTNVFNSLKPSGLVRFNFAADGNCSYFFKVIRDVMTREEYKPYFNDFEWPWFMPTVDEYQKLVTQFPFQESKVWGENADRYFPDKDALIGWIDQPSIVPFLKHIDTGKKKEFRDTVVDKMIEATVQNDGTCFETFRRINLLAQK